MGGVLHFAIGLEQFQQFYVDWQTADDETVRNGDAVVHQVEMQRVFVQLESGWIDLVRWEEVDRALFILDLDVFVIANEEASFRQFEYVLDVTDRANHLARSNILNVFAASNRCSLNLLANATFTQ